MILSLLKRVGFPVVKLQSVVQIFLTFVSLLLVSKYYSTLEVFALLVIYFFMAGLLVSGYLHRYCSHRAWKCPRWLEVLLMALSTTGLGGMCIVWAGIHADHHRYTDKEGDPHGHQRTFWQNMMIFSYVPKSGGTPRWILRDKMYRIQMKYYWELVIVFACIWSYIFSWQSWVLFATVMYWWQVGLNLLGHTKAMRPENRGHIMGMLWGGELYHSNHHKNPMKLCFGELDFPYFFMIKWFDKYK